METHIGYLQGCLHGHPSKQGFVFCIYVIRCEKNWDGLHVCVCVSVCLKHPQSKCTFQNCQAMLKSSHATDLWNIQKYYVSLSVWMCR